MAITKFEDEDIAVKMYDRRPDAMLLDKKGNYITYELRPEILSNGEDTGHDIPSRGYLHCKTPYGHSKTPLVKIDDNDGQVYWDDAKLQSIVNKLMTGMKVQGNSIKSGIGVSVQERGAIPYEGLEKALPKELVAHTYSANGTLTSYDYSGQARAIDTACRAEFKALGISYDKETRKPMAPKSTPPVSEPAPNGWGTIKVVPASGR